MGSDFYTPRKPKTGRMAENRHTVPHVRVDMNSQGRSCLLVRVRLKASNKGEQNDGKQSRPSMWRSSFRV